MNTEFATVAFNAFFMVGIWWLIFVGLRQYRIDAFRQELFSIRDELFDYAASGEELTFDSKAYGLTRTSLNGMIRFAHQFTFARSIVMVLADKVVADGRHSREYENQMLDAMLELSPKANKRIEKARRDTHKAVFKYVVLSSPLLWFVVTIAFLIGVWKKLFKLVICGKNKGSRRRWASIDAEAWELGESIRSGCNHQIA